MFDRFFPAPLQHPAFEYAAAAGASLGVVAEKTISPQTDSLATEAVSSAHEAVEVVLQAADHVSTLEQKSVNLQFSVGDADLSVHVELHGNEVRTTFRTESSDLRDVLSYEWQAVSSPSANGDRAFRMAPAVFGAPDQSALNGFGGDASSRQRDPHADHGASPRFAAAIGAARGTASAIASAPSVSSSGSPAASATSLHLHTLA